ncbi:hypothetical protein EDD15DRAFT_2197311 [Pisolithus albus]|nr:hypothetical protein EDD15DRAFT_2197311 [Pisolithus albus]
MARTTGARVFSFRRPLQHPQRSSSASQASITFAACVLQLPFTQSSPVSITYTVKRRRSNQSSLHRHSSTSTAAGQLHRLAILVQDHPPLPIDVHSVFLIVHWYGLPTHTLLHCHQILRRQRQPAPPLPPHDSYAVARAATATHSSGGRWPFDRIYYPWTLFPTPGAGSIPQWSPATWPPMPWPTDVPVRLAPCPIPNPVNPYVPSPTAGISACQGCTCQVGVIGQLWGPLVIERLGGRSVTIRDLLAGIYAFFQTRITRAEVDRISSLGRDSYRSMVDAYRWRTTQRDLGWDGRLGGGGMANLSIL